MNDLIGKGGLSIKTPDDAKILLQNATKDGGFDYFSSKLKTIAVIRKREKRKKKLNAADKQELCNIYLGATSLARYSYQKEFREQVPEREIAVWFEHCADILQQKINDEHWIRTGTLLEHDALLFSSFCALGNHPLPAVMTFEKPQILEIVTSMMLSRKNGALDKLPAGNFAENFELLMYGLMGCGILYFDNTWKPEKVLKKLEATGILEQYFRCATIPPAQRYVFSTKQYIFRTLLHSTAFVRRKLKEGTPCGNTLREIVKKGDNNTETICSYTLPYLQSLVKLSTVLQVEDDTDCHYCMKVSSWDSYMQCGRCKRVHYCSRECQKADWKRHKKFCFELPKSVSKPVPKLSSSAIRRILEEIYVKIMVRTVEECDKAGGLRMKDMILELDMSPDECGRIPLLKDPPEFEIVPIIKYLDGTRPSALIERVKKNEKETDLTDKSADRLVQTLTERLANRELEAHFLSFELHPPMMLYKSHQLWTNDREQPMFTEDAVDAFRIAMNDDDYRCLSTIFESEETIESYKLQIRALRENSGG